MRTNTVLFALLACSLVVAGAHVANADLRNGLVGYYPLNEGTGTIAHDMSGNGHDGTLYSGITWISPGYLGGGVNDNGTADSRIQLGTWNPAEGTGQLSLVMWIRWAGGGGTYQGLLGKRNTWPGTTMFQFQVRPENGGTFRLETGSYAIVSPNNTLNPLVHTWVHVAATFDGTTARLYLNGKQVASGAYAFTMAGTGSMMGIGSVTGGGAGLDGHDQTFLGDMDEVGIFNRTLSADEVALAMAGLGGNKASNPRPADKATDVPRDATLGWDAVKTAATRDVYFGTAYADVNTASRANPGKALVSKGQTPTTFAPGGLGYGQTYYWRIDEVNGTPDATIFKGDVWSFAAEPFAYPIKNLTVQASSQQVAWPAAKTIDGSGLNAEDQHSNDMNAMWMSMGMPAWIQYTFDQEYKLGKLWVWNANSQMEAFMGFGAKNVKIEYSVDGNVWTELAGVPVFAQAPGTPTYTAGTIVNFGGVIAKYVKLTINTTWGNPMSTSLSEVRFFSVPVKARAPQPGDKATGVSVTTDLTWRPGREAGSHKVFFGTDPNAVAKGTATATTVTAHSFTPASLWYGTTYYWRVDEVNTVTYPGDVWSFTTTAFGAVDDFERYNDSIDAGTTIFQTWIDGVTDSKSGSQVGYITAPFAEQTIVHGGHQSMPLAYDNSKVPFYSETTRDLGTAQDWTANGATHMDLWFRGYAAPTVPVPMTNGVLTLTGDGADIWNNADDFVLAYKTLSGDGTIVARVVSVGTGTNTWAKGGVMIRADLTPGASDAYMVMSGGAGNGASFQYRLTPNGGCVNLDAPAPLPVPYWVKLTRTGSTFTGYMSADGKTWAQQGTSQTITMINPVVIGICVCSHQAGEYRTMQFDNISTTGSVSSTWLGAQISSSPHNAPAGLYVAVTDNAGKSKLEVSADPAATNATTWTQWTIPLSDLTAAGLKTTAIKKITIGVGDKTSPTAGGTGIVFIDDIGLGHPSN
jgi:hypothetical protein